MMIFNSRIEIKLMMLGFNIFDNLQNIFRVWAVSGAEVFLFFVLFLFKDRGNESG